MRHAKFFFKYVCIPFFLRSLRSELQLKRPRFVTLMRLKCVSYCRSRFLSCTYHSVPLMRVIVRAVPFWQTFFRVKNCKKKKPKSNAQKRLFSVLAISHYTKRSHDLVSKVYIYKAVEVLFNYRFDRSLHISDRVQLQYRIAKKILKGQIFFL